MRSAHAKYDSGMAYMTEFFESKSGGSSHHSTCSCGWKVAERDGQRVLQLDTDGSDTRKDQGTVSQSIQVDEEQAKALTGEPLGIRRLVALRAPVISIGHGRTPFLCSMIRRPVTATRTLQPRIPTGVSCVALP